MPVLEARVSATNDTTRQSEPSLTLLGADPSRFEGFGQLRALDGSTIDLAAIGADTVVLSDLAAADLDASAGDQITIFYENEPHRVTVAAIAENGCLCLPCRS
jgi:ABC-type lipoprotein release transport system permease subunit